MRSMRIILSALALVSAMFFYGCEDLDNNYDSRPPSEPTNVWTITGDNRVDIYWDDNPERDLAGYNVYYSYSYDGEYKLIGYTTDNSFVDNGANNGVTYYYAVTAYDFNGNESELSTDVVYDTPRPEGFNQGVFDFNVSPDNSGYDFSSYSVTSYNSQSADFYFEIFDGAPYLDVWDDTDIQDMGATQDIYDVDVAPTDGWVPDDPELNYKYIEAVPGHSYVIWTNDFHYAKIRIRNITDTRIIFDWAYQLVKDNRELKRGTSSFDRNNMPQRTPHTR